jgi:hypothetical protein
MIEVIEVLAGELRVSSRGLFRVAIRPSGRIIGELLAEDIANEMAAGANAHLKESKAVVLSYSSLIGAPVCVQ